MVLKQMMMNVSPLVRKTQFVKTFVNNWPVIDQFNATNKSKFLPTIKEELFGIMSGPYEKDILKNYLWNTTIVRCITKLSTFLSSLIKFYLNKEYKTIVTSYEKLLLPKVF